MFDKSAFKIIFTGPVGAGKTTAIESISDTPVISTEQRATDSVKHRKKNTTVAMDYGMMKLDQGDIIHIYGTPGQRRFDFMWDILVENALGVVVLVDNASENPLQDLSHFLHSFDSFIRSKAMVIGITRTDVSGKQKLTDYHRLLKQEGFNLPVFEVDARNKREISMLIQALLFSVDQTVDEEMVKDSSE